MLLVISITFGACRQEPKPTTAIRNTPDPTLGSEESVAPDATPSAAGQLPESLSSTVLFSEVLVGIPEGNNHEFIELYNVSTQPIDLDGWTLWYLTRDKQEPALVYSWQERSDIPGYGHYLLIREGESFEILPDAVYDAALFEGKGGLILRDASGEEADRFGWGDAPEGYYSDLSIIEFAKGDVFERLPGGDLGNGTNTGNNAADFITISVPNPQNTGSMPRPLNDERLSINLEFPDVIPPGEDFELAVQVMNLSSDTAENVKVSLPIASHLPVVELMPAAEFEEGRVSWEIDNIGPGKTHRDVLILSSPIANVDTLIKGYYAESEELSKAYGQLRILRLDGSAIPIEVARSLPEGSVVTVEGIVTMYPGGFFAGSSSAKFYIEDETGGVQIFADGGRFDISVNMGNRVRVTGHTELFRDSLEVIPRDNKGDIEVLERSNQEIRPTEITVVDNETKEDVLGRLNVIEGIADRIEEFTFHYEIDLSDEVGNHTQIYIEKDTGITADPLRLGSRYQITGISEKVRGIRQLKPRLQSDIVEIFPPILALDVIAPSNTLPGEMITLTLTAHNHTASPMTNVLILAETEDGNREEWPIPILEGHGASKSATYIFQVPEDAADVVDLGTISVGSDEWPEPTIAQPEAIYIGEGVPIWAIQGAGARSPLIGQRVTAVGAVTGNFPEMDGFFMQSLESDGNPATSDGIFVTTENLGLKVQAGDIVEVNGRVREDSGQTIIRPAIPSDIVVLSEGNNQSVEPTAYDPAVDSEEAQSYKESLEGMLVTLAEPATVIAPTNRFGEFAVVSAKWNTDMIRRDDGPVGNIIWIDDGTFNSYEDQTDLPVPVGRGDVINNVIGLLAFTFGNYKIAPIRQPDYEQLFEPLPTIPETNSNQLSIATFNLENLFDTEFPHPDSPPRLSEDEYQLRLHKVAESIIALGAPTILALQEVENIDVLHELVAQPQLAGYDYSPVLLEGNDSRGIDVGYLVRTDRATVEAYAIHDPPNDLFSRPPLVLTTTVHLESGDHQLILLNNHFLSMAAGEIQTEPVRNNQAGWNVSLIEQLQADNLDASFIVLGDLNSFYRSKPINTLRDSGLRHAYESIDSADDLPYTYIFDGATQTLDHVLMTEDLFQHITMVEALHTNADYPIAHPDDNSPRRVSDHDPLIVIFTYDE
jgi:predicted extracellular nuclease